MRRKYTLITSGGQKFDINKSFFLGQWCDENLDTKHFINHHWNNKSKRFKDHEKLEKLYYKILKILVKKLNEYHKKKENKIYWEIIIGPWLIFYLSAILDRWETLRIFFKKNNKVFFLPEIKLKKSSLIPKDTINFYKSVSSNKWNASVFFKMIKYQYNKNILIKKKIDIKENKKKSNKVNLPILKSFFYIINNFLCIPALKINKIILDDLFYSSKFTLILNLKLFQIPSILSTFFTLDESKEKISISKRLKIAPSGLKNKNLMNYILENIFLEIPKYYLEDFNYIEKKNFSINNLKKKLIVVNTSYAFNERFKFWLAKMKKNGSKIFVTSHGGFLSTDVDGFLRFEKRISDKYLTWNKQYQDKNGINLPPIQLEKYKNLKQIKRESCLIIASGVLKYARKLQSWPYSEGFKIVQNFHIDLINNLNDQIKKKIIFRPLEDDGYFKITNNIKKRFKFLSISNSREISLSKEFESAKIIVCSYPETPINDALFSNIPFVILYPENLYSDFKKYKKILLPLKKNQILFNDPKKLSIHLNNIWNDPGKWWLHKKTQDCIKKFKGEIIFDQNEPLNKWADYLSQFK